MRNIILLALLVVLSQGLMADIYSTPTGGYWSVQSTWEGGSVPLPGANVIIQGPITVDMDVICTNLTVATGGSLINYRSHCFYLTVNGNLDNAGIILNNDMNYLEVFCNGDFINSGTFSARTLYISGTANQNLSNSGIISPLYITDTIPSSSLTLLTDLSLTNTIVDMNYSNLVLNGNIVSDLSMSGGYLQEAIIQGGNGATLTMWGDCYLDYVSANELILEGVVIIGNAVSFVNLYNNATIYNNRNNLRTLNITQRLENHGIIRNHPEMNWLGIYLEGDLYNYGAISNNNVTFGGAALHHIYQDASAPDINCPYFTVQTDSGNLQLLSDLAFSSCIVNFNGKTMLMYLDSSIYNLELQGGYLNNATLSTNGFSTLEMSANAYLDTVTAGDLILEGVVIVAGGVSFGNLYNNATIYNNRNNYRTLNITQRLENHGIIRNHPEMNWLGIYLEGDLYNYGTISNYNVTLGGADLHHIYQDASAPNINCLYFTMQTDSGNLQLLSDLAFSSCIMNLNGKTMLMYLDSSIYNLELQGGYLNSATLSTNGFSTLEMSANAYLNTVTAGDIILQGTVIILNSVIFDDTVVYGTVYNYVNGLYDMICNGNLVNYGTIRNNTMNYLYLHCRKNLTNYGTIQNQQTFIDGTADQYLLVGAESTISCPGGFTLVSDVGAAQWWFNGVVNNSNYYTSLTITPTILGVWQPYNGTDFGREIILGTGETVTTPQNLVLYKSGPELKLQWDEVTNAIYYTVYTSSDPNGTYYPLDAKVFDYDLTDGIVWMDNVPFEPLKFYKVSAGN